MGIREPGGVVLARKAGHTADAACKGTYWIADFRNLMNCRKGRSRSASFMPTPVKMMSLP